MQDSIVNYPEIIFADGFPNDKRQERINQLLYEMAMLNYSNDLEEQMNACFTNNYHIITANEQIVCIYYMQTISSGVSSVSNFEDVITISLSSGKRVSLEEYDSIDHIMSKIKHYRGSLYTDDPNFHEEEWEKHKKDFIEEWMEDKDRCYYGCYLYEGRLGILFDYYRTGRVRIAFEFEDVIEF